MQKYMRHFLMTFSSHGLFLLVFDRRQNGGKLNEYVTFEDTARTN